jgi:hypothetical protein
MRFSCRFFAQAAKASGRSTHKPALRVAVLETLERRSLMQTLPNERKAEQQRNRKRQSRWEHGGKRDFAVDGLLKDVLDRRADLRSVRSTIQHCWPSLERSRAITLSNTPPLQLGRRALVQIAPSHRTRSVTSTCRLSWVLHWVQIQILQKLIAAHAIGERVRGAVTAFGNSLRVRK